MTMCVLFSIQSTSLKRKKPPILTGNCEIFHKLPKLQLNQITPLDLPRKKEATPLPKSRWHVNFRTWANKFESSCFSHTKMIDFIHCGKKEWILDNRILSMWEESMNIWINCDVYLRVWSCFSFKTVRTRVGLPSDGPDCRLSRMLLCEPDSLPESEEPKQTKNTYLPIWLFQFEEKKNAPNFHRDLIERHPLSWWLFVVIKKITLLTKCIFFIAGAEHTWRWLST